jgi:Lrp/AsnC family leucine-responsive transcriptional regulator
MSESVDRLDAIDMQLLELMQASTRTPMAQLADVVGLSEPAVYKRVQRLRASGAIVREIALVAPRTMGWPLTMLVLVTLERERSEIIDRFIQQLSRVSEVVEAWYVTGDHDFVLHVVAESMEAYEAMTRRVLYANEFVKSFKTLVTLRPVKPRSPIARPHAGAAPAGTKRHRRTS